MIPNHVKTCHIIQLITKYLKSTRDVNWKREDRDSGSSCGPFLSDSSTIIDLTDTTPELFFNQFFGNRMWTIITEETNANARTKSNTSQGKLHTDTDTHTHTFQFQVLFQNTK